MTHYRMSQPTDSGRFWRRTRGTASVLSFNHDGLEIARVKKRNRWLPMWHIIFVVYLGLMIRLVVMADIGPGAYGSRMAELKNGTMLERGIGYVMQMDPVSHSIAINVRRGMRKLGMV